MLPTGRIISRRSHIPLGRILQVRRDFVREKSPLGLGWLFHIIRHHTSQRVCPMVGHSNLLWRRRRGIAR